MKNIVFFLKIIPVLIAAILIGNWFLAELKRANATGKPWYSAYISVPGLLILLAILVIPIVLWLRSH
ncbi:MAG: hypothetical protein DRH90_04955 [Deltaproteobacteria bacterium]|nr:MAG: hypothetical protein DRH90_04955 [Deltaproteobacteria bacterium]RLC18786.1 MAG: hypothetical protein DRI24_02080 [Deltaproteobacteria bacterium]